MNWVDDDEEIRDVGAMKDEDLAAAGAPALPLKPWEHYTIADGLLREARGVLAQANEAGRRLTAQYNRDPLGTEIREMAGGGVGQVAAARLQRAQVLAEIARAHSEQAAAGALLQQHLASRFSELWSAGNVASTSKEERDAELDAFPGTARRPA